MSLSYFCASIQVPSGCPSLSSVILWSCRVSGLATATCMSGVGVEVAYFGHPIGWYALAVAVVLVLLETLFMVHLCVSIGFRPGKLVSLLLDGLETVDSLKKCPLYVLMSIACFCQPTTVWLLLIPGSLLLLTGALNLVYSIAKRRERTDREGREANYDRFDEFAENINSSAVSGAGNGLHHQHHNHVQFPAEGRLEIPGVCIRHQLLKEDMDDEEDFVSV